MKFIFGLIALCIGISAWYLHMGKDVKSPQLYFFLGVLYIIFLLLTFR